MNIQKIRIISNNICYGPGPSPKDEVEQHLTISANGEYGLQVTITLVVLENIKLIENSSLASANLLQKSC